MYTLVNEYGNRVVKTDSAIKKDRLLKEGFRLVEEVEESAAPVAVSEPEDSGDEPKTVSVEGVAAPSEGPAAVSEPKTPKSNKGKGVTETAKKTPAKE